MSKNILNSFQKAKLRTGSQTVRWIFSKRKCGATKTGPFIFSLSTKLGLTCLSLPIRNTRLGSWWWCAGVVLVAMERHREWIEGRFKLRNAVKSSVSLSPRFTSLFCYGLCRWRWPISFHCTHTQIIMSVRSSMAGRQHELGPNAGSICWKQLAGRAADRQVIDNKSNR